MHNRDFRQRKEEERDREIARLAIDNPFYAYVERKKNPDLTLLQNKIWERQIARELGI